MSLASVRNLIVIAQMATMLGLIILFWMGGQYRLALAQACYVIATAFLFIGVK